MSFLDKLIKEETSCPFAFLPLLLAPTAPKTVEAVIGQVIQSIFGARVLFPWFLLAVALSCLIVFCAVRAENVSRAVLQ